MQQKVYLHFHTLNIVAVTEEANVKYATMIAGLCHEFTHHFCDLKKIELIVSCPYTFYYEKALPLLHLELIDLQCDPCLKKTFDSKKINLFYRSLNDFKFVNTLDARSRYIDFAQTSLRRQKSVYRRHGILTHAPEVGIPTARVSTPAARSRYTDFVF